MNKQQSILDHIVNEYVIDTENKGIRFDTPLIDQGIIDSMAIFRLIAFLEETFEINIEPVDVLIHNFKDVEAIAALVNRKVTA